MSGRRFVAIVLGLWLLVAGSALGQAPPPGMVAPSAPPPPPAEAVPPPPPGPPGAMVWQPGYWSWDGRAYVWVAGVYARRPHRHAMWVAPRWVAGPHGWVWEPGHWH